MKECTRCGTLTHDGAERCPQDDEQLRSVFPGPPIVDGRYLLTRSLGRGGMGLVCLAEHLVLKRRFAIKLILPERLHDPAVVVRFRAEAEALGRLEHPHVVQVTDYGVDQRAGDVPFLVMEYLEGRTLRQRLKDEHRLALAAAFPIFDQIASALDFAHRRGILHRDLKPENVFLTGAGEDPGVKLLDLGLARFLDRAAEPPGAGPKGRSNTGDARLSPADFRQHTLTAGVDGGGIIVGTAPYLAPEAVAGAPLSPACDIYSFGVLAFETLTGRRPFEVEGRELGAALERTAPPRPSAIAPDLPEDLDPALLAPLAADAARRPATGVRLVAELRARDVRTRRRAWAEKEHPRRTALALALAITAVVLAALLAATPLVRRAEDRLIDLRFFLSEPRAPDSRILLLAIDEASLDADPTSLVDMGDVVGKRLAQALESGAAGVGIDVLLPLQWSRREGFAKMVIEHADKLVLAARSDPGSKVVGAEAVSGLITIALGTERAAELFAFVNLTEDHDGVVRRLHRGYLDADGETRPSFAARAAALVPGRLPAAEQVRLIDYRVDGRLFERISWKELAAELEHRPQRFRGRLILLGIEFAGSGDVFHSVPHPASVPRRISGLVMQGLIVNTLIGKRPLYSVPQWSMMVAGALVALMVTGMLLWHPRIVPAMLAFLGSGLLLEGISMVLFRWYDRYLPITGTILLITVAVGLALIARRRLPARPRPR
ncbi:MAG: protein kinase [bacterium]|nr:protein kinase [bacterium]